MNNLKRIFTVGLMLVTVLSMSVVAAPQVDAAASAGDLIKMDGLSSVYYLGADGKRYVFPNESTYFSWYSDFSSVVTIPQSELESYPLGANVTVRPGTKLVKITTNPKVYAVESEGSLIGIADEAAAEYYYGENWNQRVVDVADSFFTNYTIQSSELTVGDEYPEGSLVQLPSESDIYYITEAGTAKMIADESAFLANRFKWSDVLTADATYTLPTVGSDIAGADSDIIDTSQGGGAGTGVQPGVGTGVTVALASDTPAAMNVPSKASKVAFAKVNFTASNDGDVTVKNVVVKRDGLGVYSEIDKVYLYQGDTRLTNGRSVNSSSNTVTFNSVNLEVPAGMTKSLTIVADIADLTTAGNHALGIAAASAITTDGASVSGSFPVMGNTMSFSTTAVAALTVTQNNGTSTTNVKIGQDEQEVADFDIDNDNVEDVQLTRITLTNGGNADPSDLGNIKLYYQGSEIADGVLADEKIDFDFDAITIDKGDSNVNFKVKADIEGGMNNTLKLYIANAADVVAVGDTYGYNASVTVTAFDSSAEAYPLTFQGSEITVNLATDNAETVIKDQTDFVFGTLEVDVKEDVEINEVRVTIAETEGTGNSGVIDIDNLELYNMDTTEILDGTVVSGNGDSASTSVVWKFEDFTFSTGEESWQVRGDIPSTANSDDAYQISFDLNPSSTFDAQYAATNDAVTSSDMSQVTLTGKTKTIGASALTVYPSSFNNGDAVANTDDVVIAGGSLKTGSVSGVNITEMIFEGASSTAEDGTDDSNAYLDSTNVELLALYIDGAMVSSESTLSTEGEVTFDSLDIDIAKNTSVDFEVKLNIAGTLDATNQTVRVQLRGISATDDNNDSVNAVESGESTTIAGTATVDFGRVISLHSSGSLEVSMANDVDDVDATKYVLASVSDNKIARVKMKASYEDVDVTKLVVSISSGTVHRSVDSVSITDSAGTVLASADMVAASSSESSATFENEDGLFTVEKGTEYFFITADVAGMGDGASETAVSGDAVTVFVEDVEAIGDSGVKMVDGASGAVSYAGTGASATANTGSANEAKVVGTMITSVTNETSGTLAAGSQEIFRMDVTVNDGTNASSTGDVLETALKQLLITVNYYSTTASTATVMKLYREGKSGYATTTVPASGSEATFDLDGAASNSTDWSSSNYEIAQGSTATFYVKTTIDSAGDSDYIQVTMPDIDSADFTWHDGDNDYTELRLDYSELSGVTLQ
ncbi:hypothetical protein GF382_02390 [Candidatus Falkowbacteria bacterium]|nr:hypothetical protein [Candidatus Falkowbacteria bacterium]